MGEIRDEREEVDRENGSMCGMYKRKMWERVMQVISDEENRGRRKRKKKKTDLL
jgi:hypothetical protein